MCEILRDENGEVFAYAYCEPMPKEEKDIIDEIMSRGEPIWPDEQGGIWGQMKYELWLKKEKLKEKKA